MSAELRKADINQLIRPGSTNVIFGKRGSGKSVLMRDIMSELRHIPKGVVFSGTEHLNPFYSQFLPATSIYDSVDSARIEQILEEQAKTIREEGRTSANNEMFVIFDDCVEFDSDLAKRLSIFSVALNITVFSLEQHVIRLRPSTQTFIDNVFFFNDKINANIHNIWKFYGGLFSDSGLFSKNFTESTKNYGTLVIKLTQNVSNTIEDNVFWYRAEL